MVKLPPIINHAYLMLTENCNLRCEYCYIRDRKTKNEFDYDLMPKVKNMFSCFNKPRLIFFGGEPLLKLDLIKKIVENYKDDFQFQVVTNGTVNLHQFMNEVYEPNRNIFDVQISWDGTVNTRPSANGNITYPNVYESIIEELEKGRILVGRAVLNDESVKYFYNTYDTYKNLNKKYKFGGDFTIAHQKSFDSDYAKNLYYQLTIIYMDIQKELNNDFIYIPNLLLKTITNIIQSKNDVISCDVGTHVVIKPNGDLYPCTILSQQDERFRLGNLRKNNCDTEIIQDLRYDSHCLKDCQFKSICDGGCRYERIINFSNDWKCEVCNHTCDIYESLYKATKEFLDKLSSQEEEKLYNYLQEYNLFCIDYDNGVYVDNQKRLLNG